MPPAVFVAVGFSAAAAAAASAAVITSVITLGISLITQALIGKPKQPEFDDFLDRSDRRTRTVRSAVEGGRTIYGRQVVSGPLALVESTGSEKQFAHIAVLLAAHECDAVESIFLGDDEVSLANLDGSGFVTSGKYKNLVRVRVHLGSPSQQADNETVAEIPAWTANHRLQGICHIILRLRFDEKAFPQGIPNVRAKVRGKKLFDPRTGQTAWSENLVLMAYDFLTDQDQGLKIPAGRMPTAWWGAQASIADEDVDLGGGQTQKRYHGGGVISSTSARGDSLGDILTGAAAAVVWSAGNYYIYVGAPQAPVATIDYSWLRDDIEVSPKDDLADTFNFVAGTFVDPDRSWAPTDFPPVSNTTYEVQDGKRLERDINLPFTPNSIRAQRLAKIHMEKSRQSISVTLPCNLKAMQLRAFDNVLLDLPVFGFVLKKFKVLSWNMAADGIDLVVKEEADADYDWNFGDATVDDPAPNTSLQPATTVRLPGGLDMSERLVLATESSGLQIEVTLQGQPSPDRFVKWYAHEYRAVGETEWIELGPVQQNRRVLPNFAKGRYDFRVKAINSRLVESDYVTTRHEVKGVGEVPSAPTGLTLSAVGGVALLRWDQAADLDVKHGGKIRFRHSNATASASWAGSVSIGDPIPGDQVFTVLPLKPGTYLAKSEDFNGNLSSDVATVVTDGAQAVNFSTLSTITESPTFPGTKTDVEVSASKLRLAVGDLVDSYPNVDTLANWDEGFTGSGAAATGTYLFQNSFDLTTKTRVRLRTVVSATVTSNSSNIDDRAQLIDTWPDIDDIEGGLADAVVFVRATDDDPAGSPTWSEWQRLESGEFDNRAFEFKVEFTNEGNEDFNIEIDTLSVEKTEVA